MAINGRFERAVSGLGGVIGKLQDFFQSDACANCFSSCADMHRNEWKSA